MSSSPEANTTEVSTEGEGVIKTPIQSKIGLFLGPVVFVLMLVFVDLEPGNPQVTRMAAIVILMAIWWITEAIPLSATALLPIVLFPLMGIMRGRELSAASQIDASSVSVSNGFSLSDFDIIYPNVANQYMDWLILLFMGGFIIATAVEKWDLHKRIALHILRIIGGQPHRLVLGFMVATGFLSMWLSNTATALMMMPMGMSLILLYEEINGKIVAEGGVVDDRAENFSLTLLLGIAYSASIGGFATLIGTPPNGVLVTQMSQLFPDAPDITFASWMLFALPMSAVYMLIAWFVLTRFVFPLPASTPFSGREFIQTEIAKLGPMSVEEKRVSGVFFGFALLLMTRKERLFGADVDIFGWSHYLDGFLTRVGSEPVGYLIDDGSVSIAVALTLFMIPAGKQIGGRLMDWEDAKRVPWGILLLFGGGLAIAKGFSTSGLGEYVAGQLQEMLGDSSPLMIVMGTVGFITAFTEVSSNTATISLSLPIMASLSQAIGVHPLLLLIPTTLAASCAFMLPVSTPPNAIVYGSGRVPIMKMVIAGIWLDILSVILLTFFVYTLGHMTFGVLGPFPDWAIT
ncbi:MAG: SLC13/DASS family transporter [Gammaproteobacteria bacterium]|jgi:sodium-dependent dicarboxylate transporter 2/3/5|nr:SLC13/DASS family transporter [Gammaproteobacteria bacterium]MBT3860482.1 SLC13/DASS family transporter [Gammaproteobacteria bacterium]MBT3987931.1 SLC13/DASS family transporter [Gammaproteobacteria bacterium]MBT4582458.1 SLC13/DASS family transporter [Gammaproteobacteria bacterium]MBT4659191.1 SLC13/DASS family transporter [Gammaproteobacteria bacterium]